MKIAIKKYALCNPLKTSFLESSEARYLPFTLLLNSDLRKFGSQFGCNLRGAEKTRSFKHTS